MPSLGLSANVNDTVPNVAPNDIYLDNDGNIALTVDLQCVLQNCSQAAKTVLGEMVLNTNQGVPYFQTLFAGVAQTEQYTTALRQAFLAVTGVVEVVSLMTSQDNNQFMYTAVIRTIYGAGGISGNI